ncbi:MAG: phosphotransferase, partial [Actinomycetota bacterium]|nr:phosphotransferase [Actinomycetota bacterium]
MASAPLHADELPVDGKLAAQLVSTQFPQWSGLPVEPVRSTGTDHVVHRLGDHLALRFPRVVWAVAQIDKEWVWLPRLAPVLPVPLPRVVARGRPSERYPWPWLVYGWVEGSSALDGPSGDQQQLALDLAAFLRGLQRVDTAGAPDAGYR